VREALVDPRLRARGPGVRGRSFVLARRLRDGGFDVVFNLCEGLGGQGSEEALPASAIELLGLPMTGARAFTLGLCYRKDLVNAHLRAQGITVPDWAVAAVKQPLVWRHFPAIVKPAAEDASLGIDATSVVHSREELEAALARGHATWERLLVQRYVEGREINVAIVGEHVLPHSEITFDLPAGLPHIVTYAAKVGGRAANTTGGPVPRLLGADESALSARLARSPAHLGRGRGRRLRPGGRAPGRSGRPLRHRRQPERRPVAGRGPGPPGRGRRVELRRTSSHASWSSPSRPRIRGAGSGARRAGSPA
jgi:hypothetical protein